MAGCQFCGCKIVCVCAGQVLIFAEKKQDVDAIHEYLLLKGVEAVAIHGGKGRAVYAYFSVGKVWPSMVAKVGQYMRTSVLARCGHPWWQK